MRKKQKAVLLAFFLTSAVSVRTFQTEARGGRQLIESGFWRGCIQHQRENVEKEAERMGDFQWKEVLLQLQRGETQRHHSENSGKVLLF